jgi:hypothetical protein
MKVLPRKRTPSEPHVFWYLAANAIRTPEYLSKREIDGLQ